MFERRAVPYIILVWLLALAAGGAILGVKFAPSSGEVAVNNAAGEDLLATSLTTHAVEVTEGGGVPQVIRATGTVTPPAPYATLRGAGTGAGLVSLLRTLETLPNWESIGGDEYHYSGSPTAITHAIPVGATLDIDVRVQNGYMTAAVVRAHTSASIGRDVGFSITKIGDYTPPAAATSIPKPHKTTPYEPGR